jgi:membrane protein
MAMRLPLPVSIVVRAARQAWEDDVPLLGAAIGYYGLFSLLPLVMVAISLAGFFLGEQQASEQLIRQVDKFAGPELARFIAASMRDVSLVGSPSLRTAASMTALAWTASLMFRSLRDAANTVWKVECSRRWYKRLLLDHLVAYALVSLCGLALVASTVASATIAALPRYVRADWLPKLASLRLLDLLVSLLLSFLLLAVLYKVLPATRVYWSDVLGGALTAALLLAAAKSLIGFYLGRSPLTSAFGAASTLFVLLVWVYGVAWVFLFGAELCHATAVRRMRAR